MKTAICKAVIAATTLWTFSAFAQTRTQTTRPVSARTVTPRTQTIIDAGERLSQAQLLVIQAENVRDGDTEFAGCTLSLSALQGTLQSASADLARDAQILRTLRMTATPQERAFIGRVLANIRATQEAITHLNGPPDVNYDEHCYGHLACWALWVLCDDSKWECHDSNLGTCLWGTCKDMH